MKNENEHHDILDIIKDFPRVKASADFTERLFRKIAELESSDIKNKDIKVTSLKELLNLIDQDDLQDLSKKVNGLLKH